MYRFQCILMINIKCHFCWKFIMLCSQKWKCQSDDFFSLTALVVIFGNFQCSKWQKFCKNDTSVVVLSWIPVTIQLHWWRQWLGAIRQQAITSTNVKTCHHLSTVDHDLLHSFTRPQWVNVILREASNCVVYQWVNEEIRTIKSLRPSDAYVCQ